MYLFGLILVAGILVLYFRNLYLRRQKKKTAVPVDYRQLLQEHVRYYRQLSPAEQERFATLVERFLKRTHIEGVGTPVAPLDRVLVAASGIIPIFGFKDWEYFNLTNVILYPDTFDESYQFQGEHRNILGMVGSGPMNGQMLLSRNALHFGFSGHHGTSNTAIHEFVHLLDKSDGVTDGLPRNLLEHSYSIPWMKMVHQTIQQIAAGESDINPYGATNESEFFAVISEYFFEQPELLAERHPELYGMLTKIFRQNPRENFSGHPDV